MVLDYTIREDFIYYIDIMKSKILSYLFGWVLAIILGLWWLLWSYVNADQYCYEDWECFENDIDPAIVVADQTNSSNAEEIECNWIKLNTDFPIIWNCIWDEAGEDSTNAFPTMLWAITKIVMSIILVVCLIMIIIAGIMRSADNPKWAKSLIKKVAITILLLWLSWVILKLVNPNFFV